ncbi:MAG: tRNA (guanosine(46)-N7)-methyltransferase TrmB [Parabacteroides sp.]|nr:tRNA (guanosine(46)-N7)-methyltransferase TrmB [Parabacteroides sp.]
MRIRKKKWVKPFLEQEEEYLLKDEYKGKWLEVFPYKRIYLEIGMGMGDFISEQAKRDPETLYIGFEKDETCVAKAIMKAKENELKNLIIILDNATALKEYFIDGEVDLIYLHFSDPWPKKGHTKRRLTYRTFLDIYYDILNDQGKIVFKTDNKGLYEFSLVEMTNHKFALEEISVDYHREVKDEPMTGYEAKFVSLNQPIYYAKMMKKEKL